MATSDIRATEWFVRRRAEQRAAHQGETLVAIARQRCERLPSGPVTLLATSAEGVALAGAIVALREDATTWRQVSLRAGEAIEGPLAVVEVVQLGEGLRTSLVERFPGVLILDGPVGGAGTGLRAVA